MTTRLFIALTTLCLLLPSTTHAQPDRPNIILFLVDDLGWQDTSVPMQAERTPLNDRYHTPNLEALASRGTRFSNAYASAPVCTPTRTAIMTGKAPARTHITYWTLHKDTDTSKKRDDIAAPAWALNGLQPGDHETLPQILQAVGYRTIHVGKAHFGTHNTPGSDPTNLGFTVNIAGHASGGPASYYGTHNFSLAGRQGKELGSTKSIWDIPGLDKYHGNDIYLTEALALEASQAIRDSVAAGEPFYMNFAPYAVHAPIMGNKKYEPNYPDLDAKERAYASMIESYDAALGALVTTLKETDQLNNTVIIFSSDNGGLSAHARGAAPDGNTQHTHNAPLRSGKGSAYEGGSRIPTVIAWPGVTNVEGRANGAIDTPIITHDFFPTIIALAGLQADYGPADNPTIDGRDLTPLLTNRPHLFDSSRTLGWHQPHQWGASGPGIWPFTAIRQGNWKLIYAHAERRFELYNLTDDIGETNDLAGQMPERVAQLAELMDEWINTTGAQLSIDKKAGNQIEQPSVAAKAWSAEFAADNNTISIHTQTITGIGREPGVIRRDPSDVIKLGDKWFVFYTKLNTDDAIAPEGYYGTVWYATSTDEGHTWTERAQTVGKGAAGAFDSTGCFTPNVVRGYDGEVYIYYTGVGDNFDNAHNDYSTKNRTAIGITRATFNPDGTLASTHKLNSGEPVLLTEPPESETFDSFRVDDAAIALRNNQYWLYYKGRAYQRTPGQTKMGVAVADRPEGPYRKLGNGNPIQPEGHEVLVWEYLGGVASLVSNVGRGVYFGDGERLTKLDTALEGRLAAPGLARSDLTDLSANTIAPARTLWGIHMTRLNRDIFLERFTLDLPTTLNGWLPAACTPMPSPENRATAAGWGTGDWNNQFEQIRNAARELQPKLVLIGDSITQSWAGGGRKVGGGGATARAQHLDPIGPLLNAGISGDRTQHILWRLNQGMLDGCSPDTVTLMIGTNNLPHDSADDIALGIETIVNDLRQRLPDTTILVISCPPRGKQPDNPMRTKGDAINQHIAALADGSHVRWLDITPLLVDDNGIARADRMAGDFIHFAPAGYDAVAQAIRRALRDSKAP